MTTEPKKNPSRACIGCGAPLGMGILPSGVPAKSDPTCDPCWRLLPKPLRVKWIAARNTVFDNRSRDGARREAKRRRLIETLVELARALQLLAIMQGPPPEAVKPVAPEKGEADVDQNDRP